MSNHPHPIQATLNQLPSNPSDHGHTLEGGTDQLDWKLDVVQIESLGCRLDGATFTRKSNDKDERSASRIAEELCQRVNYLMEPIAVLEFDDEHRHAIARSTKLTPSKEGGGYFEIDVTPNEVEIHRFVATKGEPRKQADFCLTRESLERIANDVESVLKQRAPTRAERYLSRKL